MEVYFAIFAFLLFMGGLDFYLKKNHNYDATYIAFACVVIFLAGFRGMGNDYDGYYEIFQQIKNLKINEILDPAKSYVEPGFTLLNIALKNTHYQTLLVIMAILNVAILFPFFRKYSPYPFVTLLFFAGMFMYTGIMGLIRQHLAIAICLWAMVNLNNRRFWWLLFIATMFHYSAMFVLLAKLLSNRYYPLKNYLVIGGIAILSNFLFFGVFKLLVAFMPEVIAWKLEIYIGTEEGTAFGFNAAVAIRLLTFALAYYYRRQITENFPKFGALFVNIYFLAIIIYTGFGFLPQIAARGAVYFHYMELIVVPMILYVAPKHIKAPIFILYAAFSLIRHIDMVTTYAEAYFPYKNILFM